MKKLDTRARSLLMVGMLFMAAMTLASTFVNVYLIRLTDDLGLIILQNIANYVALLGSFLLGTKLLKKVSMNTILKLGIFSVIIYYFSILLLKEKASDFLILLGVFNGVGNGLYYFGFNVLVGKVVSEQGRASFFGLQSSFSYIFGVVAPAVSGFVIVSFTELAGYYVLFGCSLVLFVIAILLLSRLKNVSVESEYHILRALTSKNKYWFTNLYINTSFGMREVIYTQVFIVFAYKIITNEQIVGNLNSMMSLIGVFSGIFIASKFTSRTQKKFYLLAGILYFLAFMSLAIFGNQITIIFTYVVLGLVICWYNVIFQGLKYKLSSYTIEGTSESDYIIATEFPMALGRIVGLVVSLLLHQVLGDIVYQVLFAVISIMLLIDYVVIERSVHWLQRE